MVEIKVITVKDSGTSMPMLAIKPQEQIVPPTAFEKYNHDKIPTNRLASLVERTGAYNALERAGYPQRTYKYLTHEQSYKLEQLETAAKNGQLPYITDKGMGYLGEELVTPKVPIILLQLSSNEAHNTPYDWNCYTCAAAHHLLENFWDEIKNGDTVNAYKMRQALIDGTQREYIEKLKEQNKRHTNS